MFSSTRLPLLAICASLAIVLTATGAWAEAPVAGQYYLDCRSGDDAATGRAPHAAWRTLDRINRVVFQPGDSIHLRGGTVCEGTFAPQGSGTEDRPITVGGYGGGARPAIVARGARAAVFLNDVQGWEIRHLDVSTPGPPDGTPRAGVYVLLSDYGIGRHYVVQDVNVHDVHGCDCTDQNAEPTGGIVFRAAGSAVGTGFDGVQVSGNVVSGTDGFGIGTSSQWSRRPQNPSGSGLFVPMKNLRIAGNSLTDLGGSGIVVQNGIDPVIERNRIDGFSHSPTQAHLGIFAWNSDGPTVQFNEVANGDGVLLAPAYGVEAANSDVLIQYNVSHDNGGGFVYICGDAENPIDGATIRYNISRNDRNVSLGPIVVPLISVCPGSVERGVAFYNNVIYSDVATNTSLIHMFGETAHTFKNNVFFGGSSGLTIFDPHGTYDHNLYYNIGSRPAGDAGAVVVDPLFSRLGGYQLTCGSPALQAGVAVPEGGDRDIYGFPVPTGRPPNIGAYQAPCLPW